MSKSFLHKVVMIGIIFICSFIKAENVRSEIVEIATIHKIFSFIEPYLTPKTLVIFDIDNTLIRPKGHVCSSAWWAYEKLKLINQGYSEEDAVAHVLELCTTIGPNVEMILCEDATKHYFILIQEKVPYVIALTGRSWAQAELTQTILLRFNMDFSKKALKIDNQVLNHKDGIYFCNGNYKDLFLIEILKAMDELPDQIIVIDDIEKYLESMKYALEKNNFSIPFLGRT